MTRPRILVARATRNPALVAHLQVLRRSVLLTEGARENAREAALELQERRAQSWLAAQAFSPSSGHDEAPLGRHG